MKCLLLLSFVLMGTSPSPGHRQRPLFLDPTGTYILKGTVEKNRIMGHSGEIRVKLLDPRKVAMSFYINKGYPGYESGAFTDTLLYDDCNQAWYRPSKDPGCTIIFVFKDWNAEAMKLLDDPRTGCGFGNGVLEAAVFKKFSSEAPMIQDLSGHGVLP